MSAVFETVRLEDGRVRLLDRHLERLRRSGVPEHLVASAAAVVEEAGARQEAGSVVLRLDVLDCRVAVHPRAPSPATPVRLVPVPGHDPDDRSRERKTAARAWATAALATAHAAGGDDAVLVSAAGLVGETTRANVFAVLPDGTVATPPARGILPGVTRSWAIEATGAAERPLPLVELQTARAAFLTTAGRGVVPVRAVGDVILGDDPLVARLAAAWRTL